MTFRTLPLPRQFSTQHDFGFKNLIVSGASFVYNNSTTSLCTWPYYLRDLGNFNQVLDTSLPGAGNYHISYSLQWAIENSQPDPADSLVVVMWAGNTHDDYVCPNFNDAGTYPMTYRYNEHAISGITGGSVTDSGNTKTVFKDLALIKNRESRAIENYLYISSLYHFLKSRNYKFVFLKSMDLNLLPKNDFEIGPFLPDALNKNLETYIPKQPKLQVLYSWAVAHNLLDADQYHPSPDGHLNWTRQVLIPMLQSIL